MRRSYAAKPLMVRRMISTVIPPSATTPSSAVIISAKPNHRPNADDTAGACARMLAKLFGGDIFIANLLHLRLAN